MWRARITSYHRITDSKHSVKWVCSEAYCLYSFSMVESVRITFEYLLELQTGKKAKIAR